MERKRKTHRKVETLTYKFSKEEIEALLHRAVCDDIFLDGKPGTAQVIKLNYDDMDLRYDATLTAVVTTDWG